MTASDWLGVTGIIVSLVAIVISFMLGYFARKPKLKIMGSGSGTQGAGNRDLMLTHVQIYNDPHFLGRAMGRDPAKIFEARIYDPELQELVGQLLLWGIDGSVELKPQYTIESGESGRLYLFAKDRYGEEFFIYHSARLTDEPPRSPARYKEKKKLFVLWLHDTSRRQYKFPMIVRNTDQSVDAHFRVRWIDRISVHFWHP